MTSYLNVWPASDAAWERVVAERRSDVFHSPQWMRVLSRTYGLDIQAIVVEENGDPVAGIPFCAIDDLRGKRVVALPFSDFCDPLVRDHADWDGLATALISYGAPTLVRVVHADEPLSDSRFEVTKQAKWHALTLGNDPETTWAGIHSSARRAIRKARSEGVVVRTATSKTELRAFFDLHLATRKRKYSLLAQPYAFFESIWDEFIEPGDGMLLVATIDDRIVAGVIFLEWKGVLYYKFNASNPDYVAARPNDLIIWTAVEHCAHTGLKAIDFGLSDWDQEGLVRYKRKYATEERTISFLRSPAAEDETGDGAVGEMLSTMTSLFTDATVPDDITERAGDALYRFFS